MIKLKFYKISLLVIFNQKRKKNLEVIKLFTAVIYEF
jgi:hypothetical protein